MQLLTVDPVIPYIRPPATRIAVLLVGCGGTGSALADVLARLAYHSATSGGPELVLVFADGDTVEPKNIGRQRFGLGDVGQNKAQVLAARYSALFGLNIAAVPQLLRPDQIAQSEHGCTYGILVGAVDTATGRQALTKLLQQPEWHCWIDCGNHRHAGQVLAGTTYYATFPIWEPKGTVQRSTLFGALTDLGVCRALPGPHLQEPGLLVPEEAPITPADCAAAVLANQQSLLINQAMATVAGQYLADLVLAGRLTRFRTDIDLATLTMHSQPITAGALARATGLTPETLRGVVPPKAKKQRKAA